MISTADWAAYAQAVLYLAAPSGTVRIRRAPLSLTSGKFPDPQGRTVHLFTAHNPAGVICEPADNAAALASLEAELTRRQLHWWYAARGDAAWTQSVACVAVVGLDRGSAMTVGRQYGQDAIFELTPAFRLIVDCRNGQVSATGWSIDVLGDQQAEAGRALSGRDSSVTSGSESKLAPVPGPEKQTPAEAASLHLYPQSSQRLQGDLPEITRRLLAQGLDPAPAARLIDDGMSPWHAVALVAHGLVDQGNQDAMSALSLHARNCSCRPSGRWLRALAIHPLPDETASYRLRSCSGLVTSESSLQATLTVSEPNCSVQIEATEWMMPDPLTAALAVIGLVGEPYEISDVTGNPGDCASLLLIWHDIDEILIRGEAWESHDGVHPSLIYGCPNEIILAQYQYEILGGSGSPGTDDSGIVLLTCIGGHYWEAASDPGDWTYLGTGDASERRVEFRRNCESSADNSHIVADYTEFTASPFV